MAKKIDLEEREAQQGKRMIEIRIRFWTNNLAKNTSEIRPKHAWSSGIVRMERNQSHNIISDAPAMFHSLMDLPAVIEKVLVATGVTLHACRRMKKYFEAEE
jgi:hypothetical protein